MDGKKVIGPDGKETLTGLGKTFRGPEWSKWVSTVIFVTGIDKTLADTMWNW